MAIWTNSSTYDNDMFHTDEQPYWYERPNNPLLSQDQTYQVPQNEANTTYLDPLMSIDLCSGSANSSFQQPLPDNFDALAAEMYWNVPLTDFDYDYDSSPYYNNLTTPEFGSDMNLDDLDFSSDFTLFPADTPLDFSSFNGSSQEAVPENQQQTHQYRCEHCSKLFTKRHRLNRHVLKHTRPHKCEGKGCNYAFAERRDLRRHIKSCKFLETSEADLVKCLYCAFAAKRADSVRRHMETRHK